MRRTLALLSIVDDERTNALSRAYMEQRGRHLRLFSDANGVLQALAPLYPLGLITNGPADLQRQEIATLGINKYFVNVYIEGEMGEGKPKQSVFDRAAGAVGLKPEQILMVGNSFGHDISPALKYGWHAVWIRRPSDIPPSQTTIEQMPMGCGVPDAIIQHLSELMPLLGLPILS